MTDSRSTPMEVRVPLAEFKSLIEGAVSAMFGLVISVRPDHLATHFTLSIRHY